MIHTTPTPDHTCMISQHPCSTTMVTQCEQACMSNHNVRYDSAPSRSPAVLLVPNSCRPRPHINPSGGSALHADRCGLSLRPRPARVNWTFWTLSGRVVTWCVVDTVYGAFQLLTRYVDNTLCHHSIHVKGDTFTDALLLPYEYTAR